MTIPPVTLHWFRQDLRLADNPALTEAAKAGKVLPVYILDDDNAGDSRMGAASRWWLHHSLEALNASLEGKLLCLRGNPLELLPALAAEHNVSAVYWNRCYEPWRVNRDKKLKSTLQEHRLSCYSYNSYLLWEPWEVLKKDATPYKVFTPYYRNGCLSAPAPRAPLPAPNLHIAEGYSPIPPEALDLLPSLRWDEKLIPHWQIGEHGAHERFRQFLCVGLPHYKDGRNLPAQPFTSRLSPHLHFGEISPHQLWHTITSLPQTIHTDCFMSELGWREFSHYLLYHFPTLPFVNFQQKFNHFPWQTDDNALRRWQRGQTGYPIVDAGMRELWQTGYMHNRVRMIVGSFLVKNLLLDWRQGERWFWNCLVDANLANNSASWQWVAGSGADAAPYFRIFNPVSQGQKFDPNGEYTRKYVPELARLPDKYLFSPWEAPPAVLKQVGVTLGSTYPAPIVELSASRDRALAAYHHLKHFSPI